MIRISTRGRYALRALVDVARHDGDRPVARQDIAERQSISADYVAQLFQQLTESGLVEGVKGPGGGYRLTIPARTITAHQVIEAVEGPIALVHCVDPHEAPACGRADQCVTRALWGRLSETMTEILRSVTIEDLCEEAHRLGQSDE